MALIDKIIGSIDRKNRLKEIKEKFIFSHIAPFVPEVEKDAKIYLANKFDSLTKFVEEELHRLKFVSPEDAEKKKELLEKTLIQELKNNGDLALLQKKLDDGKLITLGEVFLKNGLTTVVKDILENHERAGEIQNEWDENLGMLCVEYNHPELAIVAMQQGTIYRMQQDSMGLTIGHRCVTHFAPNSKKCTNPEQYLEAIMVALSYQDSSFQQTKSGKTIGHLIAERLKAAPELVLCYEKAIGNEQTRYLENISGKNMLDEGIANGYSAKAIQDKFGYSLADYEERQYKKHLNIHIHGENEMGN